MSESDRHVDTVEQFDIKPRFLAAYDAEPCPRCGFNGTHDRDTSVTQSAPPQGYYRWYDLVTCGRCSATVKERGGEWDAVNHEPADMNDLEWDWPHATGVC